MSQLVQSACPGCKHLLRIPSEWLHQPIRCKHCGMVMQDKRYAAASRIASTSGSAPTYRTSASGPGKEQVTTAPPVAKLVAPPVGITAAAPVAVPMTQSVNSSPFADLPVQEDTTAARTGPRRRRQRGGWKGPLFAVAVCVIAGIFAYVNRQMLLDNVAALIPADPDQVASNSRDKGEVGEMSAKKKTGSSPPSTASRPKKDSLSPSKPSTKQTPRKDPSKRPPRNDTARNDPTKKPKRPVRTSGSLFPRRALLISVHDYLYANPIQNGMPGANANNLNNLINALNLGLHISLDQIAHLSDDAAAKYGPRAPSKTVIEQTLTKFLDTSRPQDRIMVFFIGHSVELDDGVYLAPIEGELDNAGTLIPLKWFYDQLTKCTARQKVLVLDVNRYNRAFGQERPGGEEMGEKLDAMLKAPPAGVQVWSSCIAKQRSIATDDTPMGIFLDSMLVALRKGGNGLIQHVEDPMPIDRYVAPVNQLMKNDLGKRKLAQESRLTGKEADSGTAYDPNQPAAPDAVTCLAPPPAGVELNKVLIENVLAQISTPPVKVTHEMALRYDALPPFPVDALKKYQSSDSNPNSPLRKAVTNARAVLWAIYPGEEPKKLSSEVGKLRGSIGVQLSVLKDGYRAPGGGNAEKQLKDRVENDERKAALLIQAVGDALEELESQPVTEARDGESKRWKANYDFILARMMMEQAYLVEYQSMLGSMRKEFPPRDPALHGGWKLASQANVQGDSTGKKASKKAHKLLDKIIKDNAGSPWEVLAKREKLTNLGLEWQATR